MRAVRNGPVDQQFIHAHEQSGRLDRALEFLPTDEELLTRKANGETLTRPELVAHLLSQTNVIACVEGGGIPVGEVRDHLLRGTAPHFGESAETFRFAGSIECLRRT